MLYTDRATYFFTSKPADWPAMAEGLFDVNPVWTVKSSIDIVEKMTNKYIEFINKFITIMVLNGAFNELYILIWSKRRLYFQSTYSSPRTNIIKLGEVGILSFAREKNSFDYQRTHVSLPPRP
jgi:hypothetical protein